MLRLKTLNEVMGKRVYTDSGDFFGLVEEINLIDNKIDGWKILISRESSMASLLGGAKGIIIPHQFIKSIGDIVLINKNAVPAREEEEISLEDSDLI
jgi:sporulation protein YlmC with PRC-barrel domain